MWQTREHLEPWFAQHSTGCKAKPGFLGVIIRNSSVGCTILLSPSAAFRSPWLQQHREDAGGEAFPGAAHVSEPVESRSRICSWHPSSDVARAMSEENLAGDFCCFFFMKEVGKKKPTHSRQSPAELRPPQLQRRVLATGRRWLPTLALCCL